MLRVKLGFSYIGKSKLAPVLRMGLIVGSGKFKVHSTANHIEESSVFYGGMSLGFYSSLGISYKVNDKTSLILNFDYIMQEFVPRKWKLLEYRVDKVDQILLIPVSEKEVEFEKNYVDMASTPNASPSKAAKISIPFSSYGPSITLVRNFGKKANKKPNEKTN